MKKICVVCLVFIMAASAAQAMVNISTADGSGADAYVANDSNMSSTSTSGNASTTLQFRYNGGGSRFRATYLRFDLSGADGATMDGATLSFDFTYIKSSTGRLLHVYGLVDESLDLWTEGSLNYQNAPGMLQPASGWNTGDYLLDDTKLVLLGTITTPGTNEFPSPAYPVPFTSNTDTLGEDFFDFLKSDTNNLVTLVIFGQAGTSSVNCEDTIASKEHATFMAPTLNLIPEPATLSLLALGGLLLRKKR